MAAHKEYTDPQQLMDHVKDYLRQVMENASSAQELVETLSDRNTGRNILHTFYGQYDLPSVEGFTVDRNVQTAIAGPATHPLTLISRAFDKQKLRDIPARERPGLVAKKEAIEEAFTAYKKDQRKAGEWDKSCTKYIEAGDARKAKEAQNKLRKAQESQKESENVLMARLDVDEIVRVIATTFIPNEINKALISVSNEPGDIEGRNRMRNNEYPQQAKDAAPHAGDNALKQQALVVEEIAPILLSMPREVNAVLQGAPEITDMQKEVLRGVAVEKHHRLQQWLETPMAKTALAQNYENRLARNTTALDTLTAIDEPVAMSSQPSPPSSGTFPSSEKKEGLSSSPKTQSVYFADRSSSPEDSKSSDDGKMPKHLPLKRDSSSKSFHEQKQQQSGKKEGALKRLSRTFSSSHVGKLEEEKKDTKGKEKER